MSLLTLLQNRLSLPAVCSPMFIISNPDLVIAQCKAGVVGSFPALNARPAPQLGEWLDRITTELAEHDAKHPDRPAAPFAVNQIVHKSNDRLEHDLEQCVRYKVPIVITSLGARTEINDAVHSYGGIVLHDVINNSFARKAVEKGADGLVAVAAGAGGHAGTQSPFALLHEIREWFDGPLLLSGAIASGDAILAAQAAGADLAYIGSAFIATNEANAQEAYKQMILESGAEDIVYSNLFTGVHGNYLRGSIERAGLDPLALAQSDPSKMNFNSGGNVKAWKDVWGAGQGVGAIKRVVPVAELVRRFTEEYALAHRRLDLIGTAGASVMRTADIA
nr:nitronate monooxygenase family protein [uncultured Cupriavidus sp.]